MVGHDWGAAHWGRSWSDTRLEDGCPCPKAPCGLVVGSTIDPECDQHPWTRGKTMRQMHKAEDCQDVSL